MDWSDENAGEAYFFGKILREHETSVFWKSKAEKAEAEVEQLTALLSEADTRYGVLKLEVGRLRAALESIARNTCCEGCGEAGRVAHTALRGGE